MRRRGSAALSARSSAFKNPSFERKSSPFCGRSAGLRRSTFRRLIGGYGGTFCGIRAVAKEVHVRASLTKRDASRVKTWQVGLLVVVLALAFGLGHTGASRG